MSKRVIQPPIADADELAIFSAEIGTCPSLDLHGTHQHDIDGAIDRFLYQEHRSGSAVVKIIHGKGTLALQRQTMALLSNHPLVGRARGSHVPSESNAVTYVALAR